MLCEAYEADLLLVVAVQWPGLLLSPPVCRLGRRGGGGGGGHSRGLESLVALVQEMDLASNQFLRKTLQ